MAKFKKGLVNDIRDEYDREEKQKKLREKYETPEDVLIVEKDNTVKFFVRTTGNVIKLVVGIIIFILAVIGLTAIVYPETRNATSRTVPAHRASSAAAAARVSGSIPVKGSSNSSVSLAAHKARSRAVRRFCPPESRAAGRASAAASMPSC